MNVPPLFRWLPTSAVLVAACGSPITTDVPAAHAPLEPAALASVGNAPVPAPDPLIDALNLDFEHANDSMPRRWFAGGDGYEAALDDTNPHAGSYSLRISRVRKGNFGVATSRRSLGKAQGKRLRLTGYIRTAGIKTGYAGLWMRVDGSKGDVLAFDNMDGRGVSGSTDWKKYVVVLDVPRGAKSIVFGALLTGDGTMWMDTMRFDVLGDIEDSTVKLHGVVVNPAGEPVANALVAATGRLSTKPYTTTVSDAAGAFAISLRQGTHGLSATASGIRGGFLSPYELATFDVNKQVRLRMGGASFTHSGTVVDEFGAAIGNLRLAILRVSDAEGDIWFTRTAADGSFAFTVMPADRYVASIVDDTADAKDVSFTGRSNQNITIRATRRGPAPDSVVRAIGKRSVRLKTVEAGNGFEDMTPLRKMVKGAHIVGLGEGTHGTREFFQLKHRMLEFLVEKLGFTVFAIEANFTESLAINDYVLHGTGAAKDALNGIYFWTWYTEEVLDLIEWMRSYNVDPKHKRKLEFYGIDMQFGAVTAQRLLDYLVAVDPRFAASDAKFLSTVTDNNGQNPPTANDVSPIVARLDARRAAFIRSRGKRAWVIARQNARILAQRQTMIAGGSNARDVAMAENVKWVLDHQPTGTRMVLWAHNGHIAKTGDIAGIRPMGMHLDRAFGNRYVAFGFDFDRGSFQARGWPGRRLREFTVGPSPKGSVGSAFSRAGCALCVLDLRTLPKKSAIATWFGLQRPMHMIGAVFSASGIRHSAVDSRASFDALIFVAATTRARPLERPKTP